MPRVLIADDNQFLRDALKAVVFDKKSNWTVCGEAANRGEAVEMAAKLHPDVILLDFQMPVMNGLSAAKQILNDSPSVPIVLYTLHKNAVLESQTKSLGVRTVISKVESFSDLMANLEIILGAGHLGCDRCERAIVRHTRAHNGSAESLAMHGRSLRWVV